MLLLLENCQNSGFLIKTYDPSSFQGTIASLKSALKNKNNDPSSVYQDTLEALLTNYNPRAVSPTDDQIAQINLDRSFAIYNELMKGNISNFTFCFSGPFKEEDLRPLIEKYIASIPAASRPSEPKDLGIHPVKGKVTKTIHKGIEAKSTVSLVFSGSYESNLVNNKTLDALKEIIQISMIKRLRQEESGVYAPSVTVAHQKEPTELYRLKILFDCSPENTDRLIAAALDEIDKIKNEGPMLQNIEKFKAEDRSSHELDLKSDFYWLQYIQNQILGGNDLGEINNYDKIVESLNAAGLKKAANYFLNGENLIRLISKPEIAKP